MSPTPNLPASATIWASVVLACVQNVTADAPSVSIWLSNFGTFRMDVVAAQNRLAYRIGFFYLFRSSPEFFQRGR